jgi:MFS family permease
VVEERAIGDQETPAIGPTLGGWITDNFTWRWVFLLNVAVGILLSLLGGACSLIRPS